MSLLNKATIITTPTAQSNGKLHSIKGGSVADFDVVRGSSATRVNAEGLIEDVRILSGELVTNGDFSDGSTGWTVVNGTITDKYNASMTAYQGGIKITPFTKIGTFKVVFDLVVTSGSCKFDAGGGNDQIYSTSGTKEIIVTDTNKFEFNAFNLGWVGTLDNVSVIEITNDTDIPRIDYTTGEGVILTEPQSTNLATYSEDFSQIFYTKDSGVVVGTTNNTSPSVNANATKIDVTNSGRIYANTATSTYYSSVFVKSGTFSYFRYAGASVDLVAETISSGTIQSYGNGWFRIGVPYTGNRPFQIQAYPDATYTTHTTTGDYYIYGAQLEEQSYATSYIPTSGVIATRLADSVTGAGDASTFNSAEGVLYAEIEKRQDSNDNFILISLNNKASNSQDSVTIGFSDSNRFYFRVKSNGVNAYIDQTIVSNKNQFYKLALKYISGGISVFIDGVNILNSTSTFTFNSLLDNVSFDFNGVGTLPFYGKTKTVAVFSEALTDEELTCLTTI